MLSEISYIFELNLTASSSATCYVVFGGRRIGVVVDHVYDHVYFHGGGGYDIYGYDYLAETYSIIE